MSSWPLVLACWWSSFCFTSSSPVATHPKTSYSLVINTALSHFATCFQMRRPCSLIPALQADFDISRSFHVCERCRLRFLMTFSKLLRLIRLRTLGSPALTRHGVAEGPRGDRDNTIPKSQRVQLLQQCSCITTSRETVSPSTATGIPHRAIALSRGTATMRAGTSQW